MEDSVPKYDLFQKAYKKLKSLRIMTRQISI